MEIFKKSPWIIHYDASSCNGCDIEVLACLTPMYDLERFGIINTGNPKHADILLITGSVNAQTEEAVLNIYNQMPNPKVVVAIGICATSGGIFQECYNIKGGINKVIPVDVYVPGCAARPESIIDGVVKSLSILEEKNREIKSMKTSLEKLVFKKATASRAQDILDLQKLAFNNEAEIYNDYDFRVLRETITDLQNEFNQQVYMKALINDFLVGVVRGFIKDRTCIISRLMVNPLFQNFGIGKKLMSAIEQEFSQVERYEVHIRKRVKKMLYFFQKLGYKAFDTQFEDQGLEYVYLEKLNKKELE